MSSRFRNAVFCIAMVVVFALPLLPEILGTKRLVFRDAQITHWPWRRVAAAAWGERRVPFINPSASGGEPMLANPNAALLYPTMLLEPILPAASAFNLHYLLHVLWACWGGRVLARRLGLTSGPAFVAGAAYGFSGMMLSYGSAFWNSSAAAAWLPWCVAALLDVARAENMRARRRSVAAASLALALQLLAGEPVISLLTIAFGTAVALVDALRSPRRRRFVSLFAGGAAAGLLGAALAAPLLLPLSAILHFTYRGQHLYSERAFGASPFAAWRLVEWFFPRFSGDPGALGAGGHWQYALHPGDLVYIWCVSFGVIPLLLIATAGLSREFWKPRVWAIAAAAILSLLFSFGSALPFYRMLFSIELLRRLRYPIKFYLLTTISVALLAGFAAQHWKTRRAGRRELTLLAVIALLYGAALWVAQPGRSLDRAVLPLVRELKAPSAALLGAVRESLQVDGLLGVLAVAVVAAAVWSRRRIPAEGYFLGLAIVVLALPWGLPLFVSADEKSLERRPALLTSLVGPGRLYVAPSLPEFNVLLSGSAHPQIPERVSKFARIQIEELIPATGAPFGVTYLFDADPDGSYGYYNRLANEVLSASERAEEARLLRAFGGRWVLEDEAMRLPTFRPVTGFVIAGRRLVLSEIAGALPELRWAGRLWRRTSLSGALELVRSEKFQPASDIVLAGRAEQDAGVSSAASLSAQRISSDHGSVDVDAQAPGSVIFSRTFFPAWKGRLDGEIQPVLIANGRDLAVAVPTGRHHVEFDYDAAPFVRGVALQGAAFALLILSTIRFPSGKRHRASNRARRLGPDGSPG